MFVNIRKIHAKIVDVVEDPATNQATATCVLKFALSDDDTAAVRKFSRSVTLFLNDDAKIQDVAPVVIDQEWGRLDAYFDGDELDSDVSNIFNPSVRATTYRKFGLSKRDELELQLELSKIENAFEQVA